jgi:hypothetical protein
MMGEGSCQGCIRVDLSAHESLVSESLFALRDGVYRRINLCRGFFDHLERRFCKLVLSMHK